MVWLFDGYPERPARLRRWVLYGRPLRRAELRHIRRGVTADAADDLRWARKLSQRGRRRQAFARLVTDPSLTLPAELAGGIVLALQFDRLTDAARPGSLASAALGAVLLTIGVFASRSRAAYEAKLRDSVEDRMDRQIVADLSTAVELGSQSVIVELQSEVKHLRDDLNAIAEDLRRELERVHDE